MTDSRLDNAMRLCRAGRLNEAAQIYAGIIATEPRNFEALHALGVLRYQSGQLEEAARLIGEAVAANPNAADANYNRACLLMRLGRNAEALASFDRALAIKPDYLEALVNRAVLLSALKRYDEALRSLDRVVKLRPDLVQAWANRAAVLMALGRHAEAVESFDRALAIKPGSELWKHRGSALMTLNDPERALESFDRALALAPKDSDLHRGCGSALMVLGRHAEAAAALETYLAAKPNDAEGWNSCAIARQFANNYPQALSAYDRAVALEPRNPLFRDNRGNLLFVMNRFDKAAEDFEMLRQISPSPSPWLEGYIALCRLHCGDWAGLDTARQEISRTIARGAYALDPTDLAVITHSPAEHLENTRLWAAAKYPPQPRLSSSSDVYGHDRIRIAYLSADFRTHATAFLMAGVFEHHDRRRFETVAVSYGRSDGSPMRARLEAAFDRFIDAQAISDADVARMLREMEIDLAIDLKGYTAEARPGILAFRPAPIQAHYLGFPGSMGVEYVDYLIADPITVPPDHFAHYAERIVWLPDTYQCNDRVRTEARMPTRAEAGLPPEGFVFCCFNNTHKILPEVFDIWMRLLARVEGSVLWLFESNEAAAGGLRRAAQARGIAPERLVFAPRTSQPEHIARQGLADLFLDTLPYSAHTGASDAVWAGVPLVTSLGTTFAGRVAASVLHAAGMDELVTRSLAEYEALALKLARDPAALASLREKLAASRQSAALFDVARITRNLEAAYMQMWEWHCQGERAVNFAVGEGGAEHAPPREDSAKIRGRGLIAQRRFEDALGAYEEALAAAPGDAEAARIRADLLFQLARYGDAIAAYDRALAVAPGDADSWNHRGICLAELKRREEAVHSFGRALSIDPAYADAWNNRGNAFFELKRFEQAGSDYARALALAPDLPYADGFAVQCRLRSCEWSALADDLARIQRGIAAGKPIADPLGFLVMSRSSAHQLACARTWSAGMYPSSPEPLWKGERYAHEKLRVAYLSGDYRPHPVAFLVAGVFEHHDRSRVETIGVSIGPEGESEIRSRIERGFDRFIEGRNRSDADIARTLRALEVDILVDLMGYTEGCRSGIAAHRIAPVQVNYLGFPGTMGAPYIDYIIADRIVIPESERGNYSEKVVYLPGAYQANDSRRRVSERSPTRAEAGLPARGFVFTCFNNNFKIAPDVFDVWMRLLKAVPDSVLWLLKDNESAAANLVREAQSRGVSADRLVFAPRVAPADHLARHRLADLFLDTLPYTAHTTASDALWTGLPLVTCTGTTFAGRVATSLLAAAGMPELATPALDEYEALALRLARDPAALEAAKKSLTANRAHAPLFDTARITRNLEAAYAGMRERARRGEKPASFAVDER
jgi:predicted O-linked N-acetylglucosamine transferase (SPINDLY family)